MLGIVSSASIACGFHAGDPAGILRALKDARHLGVVVGAHVGYRDLAGFGRREMDVGSADLIADVVYQIGALAGLATAAGTTVEYVKPHGALYNTVARDPRQAAAVVTAIREIDPSLRLMGLSGSTAFRLAEEAGLRCVAEAFADRAYTPAGTLVPRGIAGAVLIDPVLVAERVVRLVLEGTIIAIDGSVVPLAAESICIHGDSAGAVVIASEVRRSLAAAGVSIRPVTDTDT